MHRMHAAGDATVLTSCCGCADGHADRGRAAKAGRRLAGLVCSQGRVDRRAGRRPTKAHGRGGMLPLHAIAVVKLAQRRSCCLAPSKIAQQHSRSAAPRCTSRSSTAVLQPLEVLWACLCSRYAGCRHCGNSRTAWWRQRWRRCWAWRRLSCAAAEPAYCIIACLALCSSGALPV